MNAPINFNRFLKKIFKDDALLSLNQEYIEKVQKNNKAVPTNKVTAHFTCTTVESFSALYDEEIAGSKYFYIHVGVPDSLVQMLYKEIAVYFDETTKEYLSIICYYQGSAYRRYYILLEKIREHLSAIHFLSKKKIKNITEDNINSEQEDNLTTRFDILHWE